MVNRRLERTVKQKEVQMNSGEKTTGLSRSDRLMREGVYLVVGLLLLALVAKIFLDVSSQSPAPPVFFDFRPPIDVWFP